MLNFFYIYGRKEISDLALGNMMLLNKQTKLNQLTAIRIETLARLQC